MATLHQSLKQIWMALGRELPSVNDISAVHALTWIYHTLVCQEEMVIKRSNDVVEVYGWGHRLEYPFLFSSLPSGGNAIVPEGVLSAYSGRIAARGKAATADPSGHAHHELNNVGNRGKFPLCKGLHADKSISGVTNERDKSSRYSVWQDRAMSVTQQIRSLEA